MSLGSVSSFNPQPAGSVACAIGTGTPAAVNQTLKQTGESILFTNATSVLVFVRAGDATIAATASDLPVPAGGRAMVRGGDLVNTVSVLASVAPGSAGNVYATPGAGTNY